MNGTESRNCQFLAGGKTFMSSTPKDTSNNQENDGQVSEDQVTEEMIRARAYQLFEEQICQDGHAEYDWQQAENQVLSEKAETRVEIS
jgi:hypothetical protein